MRYEVVQDDHGRWALRDHQSKVGDQIMTVFRHATPESAQAQADLYNAVEEDADRGEQARLRERFDEVRSSALVPGWRG